MRCDVLNTRQTYRDAQACTCKILSVLYIGVLGTRNCIGSITYVVIVIKCTLFSVWFCTSMYFLLAKGRKGMNQLLAKISKIKLKSEESSQKVKSIFKNPNWDTNATYI